MNFTNNNKNKPMNYLGLIFILAFSGWMLFLFYSIIVALPNNPLSLDLADKKVIRQVMPQGWGFYSKSPREETLNVYSPYNESSVVVWPNNKIKNAFGIYRYGRSQGIELGLIVYNLPSSVKWEDCDGKGKSCIKDSDVTVSVNNTTPSPTICGDILIARETPIPWAYAKYTHTSKSQVAKVDVKCTRN